MYRGRLKAMTMRAFRFGIVAISCFWATQAGAQPPGSEYLQGETGAAVVLAHGRGSGPDSKVVGPLRRSIHRELGFHTLSLQMPTVPGNDFADYAATFPRAHKIIQEAIDFLAREKGVTRIYLMGHSMGARMTTSFLAGRSPPAVRGYIGVGMLQGGGAPLDTNQNVRRVRVPVLDVYADRSPKDLNSAENRKSLVSDTYRQVCIEGAGHGFRGHEAALAASVIAWLKEQEPVR